MKFNDKICSTDGHEVGTFSASLYSNFTDLFTDAHYSFDDHSLLKGLVYPLAYLDSIKVQEVFRRHGYGSQLMKKFILQAQQKGAKSTFARVADPDTEKTELISFYQSNGWSMIGCDMFPRFAKCDFHHPT